MSLYTGAWDYEQKYVWETAQDAGFNIDPAQIVPLKPGKYISSKSVLLCAGPPRLGLNSDANAMVYGTYPISALENAVLTQAKPIQKLFEIGSEISYPIPGHWLGTLNVATAFHYGPNILNVLYAYYTGLLTGEGVKPEPDNDVRSGDWYLNLASELFDYPIGLHFIAAQSMENLAGAFYFEDCMISTHQMGINAGMIILTENVAIEITKVKPIDILKTDIEDIYEKSDQTIEKRSTEGA